MGERGQAETDAIVAECSRPAAPKAPIVVVDFEAGGMRFRIERLNGTPRYWLNDRSVSVTVYLRAAAALMELR